LDTVGRQKALSLFPTGQKPCENEQKTRQTSEERLPGSIQVSNKKDDKHYNMRKIKSEGKQ
jgi:hypothetical protein